MIEDKNTTKQILGSLIKHPQFLSQTDKYNLTITDFSSKFEKYLFRAIQGLYEQGARNIQIIDIENYFDTDKTAQILFEQNNGIEFLQDLEYFCEIENFDYYYNKLKKINLLKEYQKMGIPIKEFYCEDLTDPKAFSINQKFEQLSISEIVDTIKRKILTIENKFFVNDSMSVETAANGVRDLLKTFKSRESIGLPLQGKFTNEILGGARKGTLCIRSASSGVGKSRHSVGDACLLAYPIRYNSQTCEWEQIGHSQKILFIATEQNQQEIRSMILAYLTDINESRFKYGEFSTREETVIQQAIEIMEAYENNLFIAHIPNPTIDLIKHTIREQCLLNDIEYVFYDYIFISPGLLNEFKGSALRNDELLLLFATALKDLSVELNVFIMTATQVNATADDNTNIRNERTLAGGRSTINKADFGLIMARPTKQEIEALEQIKLIGHFGMPNVVTDVYKVRSGQYTQVRIWSNCNLGTLKKEELFVTDSQFNVVDILADFAAIQQILTKEEQDKVNKILARLEY